MPDHQQINPSGDTPEQVVMQARRLLYDTVIEGLYKLDSQNSKPRVLRDFITYCQEYLDCRGRDDPLLRETVAVAQSLIRAMDSTVLERRER